tara:strand:+ start:34 stop:393 length:360 start_codon:yes stop_codon:yes gene_type:complete
MFNKVEPVIIECLTTLSIEESRKQIRKCLIILGATIQKDQLNLLTASLGSSIKMRLLGVLAGIGSFPRIISISFEKLEKTKICIEVKDNFGFGSRVGIADKVHELMLSDAQKIQDIFLD